MLTILDEDEQQEEGGSCCGSRIGGVDSEGMSGSGLETSLIQMETLRQLVAVLGQIWRLKIASALMIIHLSVTRSLFSVDPFYLKPYTYLIKEKRFSHACKTSARVALIRLIIEEKVRRAEWSSSG